MSNMTEQDYRRVNMANHRAINDALGIIEMNVKVPAAYREQFLTDADLARADHYIAIAQEAKVNPDLFEACVLLANRRAPRPPSEAALNLMADIAKHNKTAHKDLVKINETLHELSDAFNAANRSRLGADEYEVEHKALRVALAYKVAAQIRDFNLRFMG